jgi:hypothetical protein
VRVRTETLVRVHKVSQAQSEGPQIPVGRDLITNIAQSFGSSGRVHHMRSAHPAKFFQNDASTVNSSANHAADQA